MSMISTTFTVLYVLVTISRCFDGSNSTRQRVAILNAKDKNNMFKRLKRNSHESEKLFIDKGTSLTPSILPIFESTISKSKSNTLENDDVDTPIFQNILLSSESKHRTPATTAVDEYSSNGPLFNNSNCNMTLHDNGWQDEVDNHNCSNKNNNDNNNNNTNFAESLKISGARANRSVPSEYDKNDSIKSKYPDKLFSARDIKRPSSTSWLHDVSEAGSIVHKRVISSARISFHKNKFDLRSCRGKCGDLIQNQCSCQSSCLFYRTCCMDFFQECIDLYKGNEDFIIKQYSWLEERQISCVSHVIMISSCPPNKFQRENHTPDLLGKDHSNAYNLSNHTTNHGHNATQELKSKGYGVDDELKVSPESRFEFNELLSLNQSSVLSIPMYLHYMSRLTDTNDSSTEDVEQKMTNATSFQSWLMKLPVGDTSTGVMYINKSIFDCNFGNLSAIGIPSIMIPIPTDDILSLDVSTATIDSFLNHPYTEEWIVSPLWGIGNYYQQCYPDLISECPQDYNEDILIREACYRTHIPMFADMRQDNPFTRTNFTKIEYKNPFCLICNEVNLQMVSAIRIMPRKYAFTNTGAKIKFIFEQQDIKIGVYLDMFSNAWTTISCKLNSTAPTPNISTVLASVNQQQVQRQIFNDSKSSSLKKEVTVSLLLDSVRQVCDTEICQFSPMSSPCYINLHLTLALPESIRVVSHEEMKQLGENFIESIQSLLPKQIYPPTIDKFDVQERMIVNSYRTKYEIKATFYPKNFRRAMYPPGFFTDLFNETIKYMQNASYLLQQDIHYLCASLSLNPHIENWECLTLTNAVQSNRACHCTYRCQLSLLPLLMLCASRWLGASSRQKICHYSVTAI